MRSTRKCVQRQGKKGKYLALEFVVEVGVLEQVVHFAQLVSVLVVELEEVSKSVNQNKQSKIDLLLT
jgi:hypothetical protein